MMSPKFHPQIFCFQKTLFKKKNYFVLLHSLGPIPSPHSDESHIATYNISMRTRCIRYGTRVSHTPVMPQRISNKTLNHTSYQIHWTLKQSQFLFIARLNIKHAYLFVLETIWKYMYIYFHKYMLLHICLCHSYIYTETEQCSRFFSKQFWSKDIPVSLQFFSERSRSPVRLLNLSPYPPTPPLPSPPPNLLSSPFFSASELSLWRRC